MKRKIMLVIIIGLLLMACQPQAGSSPEDAAATMVALTVAAAPTDVPTATPTEISTETPSPLPPVPTATFAPTPTPGPVVFKDDFTVKSDAWANCENCEWKNGALYFGPFDPVGDGLEQLHYALCEACGEHTYYRVAVDVTFASGQAGDRIFGLVAGINADQLLYGVGVSPFQWGGFEIYNYKTKTWAVPVISRYTAIKAGHATNRIEIQVKPSFSAGLVDYFVSANGKNIFSLQSQPAELAKVGLYLEWHSVGVMYDNFEYEEIVP